MGGEEGWVAAGGVSAGEGTGDLGDGEMRRVDRWSVVSHRAGCGWRIATVPPLRRPRTETVRKKRRPAAVGMTNFKKGQKRIAHAVRKGRERVFLEDRDRRDDRFLATVEEPTLRNEGGAPAFDFRQ